jgi:2-dehydro-3-deoxyphosphogluconate aldolase/(4S)-4-hydroxy-2-oxoglutarate aldolase
MADRSRGPALTEGRSTALEAIAAARMLPVLTLDDASAALPVGGALKAGGLRCAEVTLRTPAAIDAIHAMASDADMLVGAGTVLSEGQVEDAVAAGARFIVSPGFDAGVVRACRRLGVPAIPGVATATEIQMALAEEIGVVKLFPAEAIGGVKTLRALSAPFPALRFIPTGGITAENAARYLELAAVLAIGGSWIAPTALIDEGRFDEISRRAREAAILAGATGDPGSSSGGVA